MRKEHRFDDCRFIGTKESRLRACRVRPLLLLPPALLQCFGNNPLQLPIGRAELIGCPLFNGSHRLGVYAQNETLGFIVFFGHNDERSLPQPLLGGVTQTLRAKFPSLEGLGEAILISMIQRTRINHRLCRLVGAEHYQQIAHHGRLLLLVKVYDSL